MSLKILKEKTRWKMELHIHTISSNDSLLTKIPLLLICKLKGINCIAITDHNVFDNAKTYAHFFKKYGIQVISGEEIMTTEGEIIGLFLKEVIPSMLTPDATVEAITKQGGLVYIPHPYDTTRAKSVLPVHIIASLCGSIHMMECHNGRNRNESFSNIQNGICDQFGILKVVGSDAHTFFEIGRNFAWIEPFKSSDEFMSSLLTAEYKKAPTILLAHITTQIVKTLKMVMDGNFNGLFRAIQKRRGK